MLEPFRNTRHCLASLALLALSLTASAVLGLAPDDYHKSADGETEAIYVSNTAALFQFRLPTAEGTHRLRYFLCKAQAADEPQTAAGIDLEQLGTLIANVSGGCWVPCPGGKKLLLIGDAPEEDPDLPLDELIKLHAASRGLHWLIDGVHLTKARTLAELATAVPELKPVLGELKIMSSEDLFTLLKKETATPPK